jgi:hypothetical protein
MSARQPSPYDGVARKWLALAQRRWEHVVELRDSGRWQHYYAWDELLEAVREAMNTRNEWARIADLLDPGGSSQPLDDVPMAANEAITPAHQPDLMPEIRIAS